MKTSIEWLKRYVDIPWPAGELAERLTMAGLEVEGIECLGTVPAEVIVAEILSREPHPNADRLSVCRVDAGPLGNLQIVCGAPNCDAGMKVPLAPVGTELGPGFRIKKAKIRGVASEGMLCAEDELGISDSHDGLLEFPADTPAGKPVQDIVRSDTVIDWEVTPNRPDWLCHIGIAREIAAVQGGGARLRLPEIGEAALADQDIQTMTSVRVSAPDLCPRYIARVITGVKIAPSPEWMQRALKAVGLRPINNVVDITNFVLLECGQPLHAFDYAKLAEHRIEVRRAMPGEKIVTLDGDEHELNEDNLLICDGEKGVALAGIMGGENSEISADTSTVLLESAYFNPSNIRASSRNLGISSDSSYRFERGIDIEMTEYASRRAAGLMCELAGGRLVPGVIDAYADPYRAPSVTARLERIRMLIGVDIPGEVIADFLDRLGLTVTRLDSETVTVSVPSYRRDIGREVDITEEIARLYGLNNIPGANANALLGGMRSKDCYYPIQQAREELLGLGLDETMTYSFVNPDAAVRDTGIGPDQLVCPTNPISNELGAMRPTLIPGLLQTAAHNIARNQIDLHFFEMGRIIVHAPGFPEERQQVGIILSGRRNPERFGREKEEIIDFFDIKGVLDGWLEARGYRSSVCRPAEHPAFTPGRCAMLKVGDREVAVLGRVADSLTGDMRLRHPLFMALVEFNELSALPVPDGLYRPLPQFPAVVRDISLVADAGLSNREILEVIEAMHIDILERVELFDIYEDENALGRGRKSLAYSVTYRDPGKTLTDTRVNAIHEQVRVGLAKSLPIELR